MDKFAIMEHYFSILEKTIKRDWDSPALANYKGESFTFQQVATNIEKFHIFFRAAGIKRGDKIALSARNSARWANTFLAITTYGAVAVPILCDFTPNAIANLADHSESVMLFTDAEIFAKMDAGKMPKVKAVINNNDYTLLRCASPEFEEAFRNLNPSFADKYPMGFSRECVCYPKDNDKDICVINYTSGTTSAPKGVMLR